MTEQQKRKKRRGPYGRLKYDAVIDHEKVNEEWNAQQSMSGMQDMHHGPNQFEHETNEDTFPFNIDEVFQSTDQLSDTDVEDIVNLVKNYDYEIDDDYDSDHHAEVDPDSWSNEDDDFQPLYPGSSISIGAFMLLLAIFTNKYNLIGDATEQLLKIISYALPAGHKLCNTLHEFKKFFKNLKNPLLFHYYCSNCHGIIEDFNVTNCPYDICGKSFKKAGNYFLEMPIVNQIQNLFKQDQFYENLQHRFERNVRPGTYEDIYDGSVYKSYFENNGILSNPHNISFTFNTDGASVFKSSNVSVWPLFLVINELPYKQRFKKENMILACLWFGKAKPAMGTFLKPFQKSMKILYDGIQCASRVIGSFICRGILLCGTADLPARSLLCNHIQYNGAFSCWKCEQEGKSSAVGKGHARVFPYDYETPKGQARTHENVINNSQLALNRKTSEKGIKGPSWLLFFPCFNIVTGIAIDYMHGVLLGVEKLMIELWFTQKYSNKQFSFYSKINTVDERLLSIQPTLDITRLPRSLLDLRHWKASEYRSFLLYYSAPVLFGILDSERFEHYLLLVNAMHILLKCGSNENELEKADQMMSEFCKDFAHYYDECFMRLNIHQLLHLTDCVRNLGPLYTSSCFSFEDKNGVILKMIRGTQNIDNQIVTGVSFVQKLPELKGKCISKGSECEKLYDSIESSSVLKRTYTIADDFYILGGISEKSLEEAESDALSAFLGTDHLQTKFKSFNRIELKGILIYGLTYSRMVKRNNSVVEYIISHERGSKFAQVRSFICLGDNIQAQQVLAIVEPLVCPNYDEYSNILAVHKSNRVEVVKAKNIISGCILVSSDRENLAYVCKFPNKLESD